MATLTPLSKGLIALAVVGAVASAVWHIGLKDWITGGDSRTPSPSISASTPSAENSTTPSQAPTPAVLPAATPAITPATQAPPMAKAPEKITEPLLPSANQAQASPATHLSAIENSEMGRKYLVSGDYAQARIYLEQAVHGGDGAAACLLGEMTLKGQGGILADQNKAASLFQIAQAKNIICFASSK